MKSPFRFLILAFCAALSLADDGALRFAKLGDFPLEGGQIIRNCRIGYRTWGQPNADRSNVIVVTTWFTGTTENLGFAIGPGKLFDTSKYFVVAIDALGNGVSSSPSNSREQPAERFPRFTIGDMVRSQREVLVGELKFDHVYAINGYSMGGKQTFQWVVSYPGFMDKAISIVGTPKQTSHDLLLWKTELDLIEAFGQRAMKAISAIQALELQTPAHLVTHTTPEQINELMKTHESSLQTKNSFDYAAQLRAMIAHDIYRDFGGSAEAAARSIRARLLVVVALQDQMVNPTPARELARLTKSEMLMLSGDCGHLASGCEQELLTREVRRFLDSK